MFKKGDIVECIDDSNLKPFLPIIKEGYKYVVNEYGRCRCGAEYVDIGMMISGKSYKHSCGVIFKVPLYKPTRFRKIQPSYKVVEVTENISEEIKKLVYN